MTNPLDTIEKALDYLDASAIRVLDNEYHITHFAFNQCRKALTALQKIKAGDVIKSSGPASKPLIRRTEDVDGNRVVVVAEWFYDEIATLNQLASRGLIRVEDAEKKREALEALSTIIYIYEQHIAGYDIELPEDEDDALIQQAIETIRVALGGKDE